MLSFIIGSWSRISAIIASVFFIIYTFLVNRNAKLSSRNDLLETNIEEIKSDTNKIIEIQNKQIEIASVPAPSRDELYSQLLAISVRTQKEH